jgi:Leucine-rich repeat (LRR) protein
LPPLKTPTDLRRLDPGGCWELWKVPCLDNFTNLEKLALRCLSIQSVPPLATLTALRTLDVRCCRQLMELPPLNQLTSLQTLAFGGCGLLHRFPPLPPSLWCLVSPER